MLSRRHVPRDAVSSGFMGLTGREDLGVLTHQLVRDVPVHRRVGGVGVDDTALEVRHRHAELHRVDRLLEPVEGGIDEGLSGQVSERQEGLRTTLRRPDGASDDRELHLDVIRTDPPRMGAHRLTVEHAVHEPARAKRIPAGQKQVGEVHPHQSRGRVPEEAPHPLVRAKDAPFPIEERHRVVGGREEPVHG